MCCFTRNVEVSGTNVFGRLDGSRQLLAYQMAFRSDEDVAMVLPLPTPPDSAESAVEFVDLSGNPFFFADLASGFEQPDAEDAAPAAARAGSSRIERLAVHEVGAFEASFVPSARAFTRLDPRFRLSPEVLAALPLYADWGFVVFKLKAATGGYRLPHPMAFTFPTRSPGEVFFPCVHVHDGHVHAAASFDHRLYVQVDAGKAPRAAGGLSWARARGIAAEIARPELSRGLLAAGDLVFRAVLEGEHPNVDVWAPEAPEAEADARARAESQARYRQALEERERWLAAARRSEILGRIGRAAVAAPVAALLGVLLYITLYNHRDGDGDALAGAVLFLVPWVPSVGIFVHAVTNRFTWAMAAMAAGFAIVLGALVLP